MATGPAGANHHSTCSPAHAHTLAKDRYIRIYSLVSTPLREGVFACVLSRGTTTALTGKAEGCCHSVGHITLNGTIVAFTESAHGVDSGCEGILVVGLVSKRTLQSISPVACWVDAGIIRSGKLTDLVVTSQGSVAWIVSESMFRRTPTYKVHSARAPGGTTLLDESASIVPGSLQLSNGVASWEDAGQRKSAQL